MRMANRTVEMTSGDILIGDRSVKDGDPAKLRREIGYVIQQIGLFPHRTIAENIGTVPALMGWDKSRIQARVSTLLELISLSSRRIHISGASRDIDVIDVTDHKSSATEELRKSCPSLFGASTRCSPPLPQVSVTID